MTTTSVPRARSRSWTWAAVLAAVVVATAACGGDEPDVRPAAFPASLATRLPDSLQQSQPAQTFVGKVAGSDAFVAVVLGADGTAGAYVCDGEEVIEWFGVSVSDGRVTGVSETGINLDAELDGGLLNGTVKLPDGSHRFEAGGTVPNKTGLLRRLQTIDGTEVVTGLVVLEDGIRGAVRKQVKETVGSSSSSACSSAKASFRHIKDVVDGLGGVGNVGPGLQSDLGDAAAAVIIACPGVTPDTTAPAGQYGF